MVRTISIMADPKICPAFLKDAHRFFERLIASWYGMPLQNIIVFLTSSLSYNSERPPTFFLFCSISMLSKKSNSDISFVGGVETIFPRKPDLTRYGMRPV